jgi:hypothetical protein
LWYHEEINLGGYEPREVNYTFVTAAITKKLSILVIRGIEGRIFIYDLSA